MTANWKVGIDIGGTFTDVIAVGPGPAAGSGNVVRTAKVPSRPDDPVAAVDAALAALDLDWADVADLMHGTTMATNAIVEERLAPVALIATEGFRDSIEIGRQNRRELYRLEVTPKLPPLVPEERRLEAIERVDSEGRVLTALTVEESEQVAGAVAALGVEAAAVVLQHAYANPDHENLLAKSLAPLLPNVALSHRMSPEPREFERTNTTVLNAALMPLTEGFLERLEARAGATTGLHMFHSAGGMAAPAVVKEQPLALALSGPAAGVAAAAGVAEHLGLEAVIGFDMGGTTTDTSIVLDGRVQVGTDKRLAGRPIRQLMVDVESIGAGGGSIARVEGQAIRVGPQSAGAIPGPACYGQGGTEPTVTDANLVLGYLDSERLLGGSLQLDPDQARAALEPIAKHFDLTVQVAALGIHRVANASMARALRRVTVERGVDARSCTLLAFGGAGPIHAVALAREFGIARVVVPKYSSVFSALGCLSAEMAYAQQHAVHMSSRNWDPARLEKLRSAMAGRLSAPLLSSGDGVRNGEITLRHVACIRYAGQSDTVAVPFEPPADPQQLGADFKMRHEKLYGFVTDEPWELDSLRLTAARPGTNWDFLQPIQAAAATEPTTTAECWFGANESLPTPRHDRGALLVDDPITGPAIIEDEWATIVVPPAARAWCDARGHLHIDAGAEP